MIFFFLFFSPSLSYSYLDVPAAYTLDKGLIEGSIFYNVINDNIPLLGELAENPERNAAGEFDSLDFLLNFGVTSWLTLSLKGGVANFAFEDRELNFRRFDAGLRFKLLEEKESFPALALGFNYRDQRAFEETLRGGRTVRIGGLEDETFTFSLLASKRFLDQLAGHIFFGGDRVSLPIRNESTFFLGTGFDYQISSKLLFQFTYKHNRVNRQQEENGENNIFDGKLTYFLASFLALTIQGRASTSLFQGEIPFLDRVGAAVRDEAFGYLGFGITVLYDLLR